MAYDEAIYRRRDGGPGPRQEADYRANSYDPGEYREPDTADATVNGNHQRRVPPAVLEGVFDDPEHGDPGRDRMAVHVILESALFVAAVVFALLIYRRDAGVLRGEALNGLLVFATALGLLALGAGLSLRVGAVNLAVGPVAVAAGLHYAEQGDWGLVPAGGEIMIVAAVGGLLLAGLVVGLHVPGWAASLAGALGVIVFIQLRGGPVDLQGGYDPRRHALVLFGGFAALAVLGGLLGSVKPVRRAVGRFRPVGDPARRRGVLAGAMAAGAIVLSTVFAAGAGVLIAQGDGGPVAPSPGLELTGLALGAALLGGTSAFGRRGGIAGGLLAVVLLALFLRYAELSGWRIAPLATAATAIGAGLVVTRLVEHFGRPLAVSQAEADWEDAPATPEPAPPAWASSQRQDWSSALPAQPGAGRREPWEGDRWGATGR